MKDETVDIIVFSGILPFFFSLFCLILIYCLVPVIEWFVQLPLTVRILIGLSCLCCGVWLSITVLRLSRK